jgi:hypothetical protein
MLEVTAVAVRSALAVAVVAAAVVLVARDRRLRRESVSARLMAGCAHRDSAALAAQLEEFRLRVCTAAADEMPAASDPAGEEVLSVSTPIDPTVGGGPA